MRSSAAILPVTPAPISLELPLERRWSGGPAITILPTYTRDRYPFIALITRLTVYRRSTTRMPVLTRWADMPTVPTVRPGARLGTIRRPAHMAGPIRNNIPTEEERAHGATIQPPTPHGRL